MRGAAFVNSGNAHSLYGGTGIDFLPQKNLVLTMNYFRVSQRITDPSFHQPDVRRDTFSAGVTYYLPSLRGERY
jgi:hypothetical protein